MKMEELLRKVCIHQIMLVSSTQIRALEVHPEAELLRGSVDSTPEPGSSKFVGTHKPTLHAATPPPEESDSDDEELTVRRTLEEKFKHISLDPGLPHFVGKSSSLMFIQTAMESLQRQEPNTTVRGGEELPETKLSILDSSKV